MKRLLYLVALPCLLQADDAALARDLRALPPRVLAATEGDPPSSDPSPSEMVSADLRARLGQANERSSREWAALGSRGPWEAFAGPRLEKLRQSLGLLPLGGGGTEFRVAGEIAGDGFRIVNLALAGRRGLWITANLYLPARKMPDGSMPGIVICHSHHRPKEHGELQDMGMTWARHGCAVLVPDHLGHGERRQHPFASAADFPKEFAVSRQDYHFRYDTSIQLYLAGESLAGWIVSDLMRCVDHLLSLDGVDPEKIALLGAVAGGGDPAAVAAALDRRIAAVVPFNFGGPQPETRFPLPEDVETTFNYAGGGSWESTRNLRNSAADGFLPWVIVGGIAPRRLVFAHEFNWDRPRDPVWKRLQMIYGFYETPDRLAYTHGRGELRGQAPEATHCTHIGAYHRRLIHEAFAKWFAIPATPETEYSAPRPAAELQCLTPQLGSELKPPRLIDALPALAGERLAEKRRERAAQSRLEKRESLRRDLTGLLGPVEPAGAPKVTAAPKDPAVASGVAIERLVLETEPGIRVPAILALPPGGKKCPVTIGVAQQGKAGFLSHRAAEIADLLGRGFAVCLPDLRGTGETAAGEDRGQRGDDTAHSATALMLGDPLTAARLRDLRSVIRHLGARPEIDAGRLALWGDSFVEANPAEQRIAMPRGIEGRPRQSEPLGGLLALLTPLFEPDIVAVSVNGGLGEFRSVLTSPFVLIPHDAVIPGLLTVGDLPDLAAALPDGRVRLGRLVDESNRLLPDSDRRRLYPGIAAEDENPSVADWLAAKLITSKR